MKKLLIGIFILGLTSLSYSQASFEEANELALEGITLMPANLGYLSVVSAGTNSIRVLKLQRVAASFDIKKSSIYDRSARYHEFSFDQKGGNIFATYDRSGKIVKSYERFTDVIVMPPVSKAILQQFPGWSIKGNTYLVTYTEGEDPKKVYKLRLGKDNKKKRIKMNAEGKVL